MIDQDKDYLITPLEWKIPQVDGDIDISDEELDNLSYDDSSDAHLSTNPMLFQSFNHDDISWGQDPGTYQYESHDDIMFRYAEHCHITQLDGNFSEKDDEDVTDLSNIYSINCERDEVIVLVSFFRSFDFIWNSLTSHKLCSTQAKKECFFCYMRSSCKRLNCIRGKGPRNLKMIEMLSEFNQLDSILGVEWFDILEDIPKLVEGILSLLSVYEKNMSPLFGLPILKCMTCNRSLKIENQLTHEIDTSHLQGSLLNFDLQLLVDVLINRIDGQNCCIRNSTYKDIEEKILILVLSHPIDVNITLTQSIHGATFTFLSALCLENSENSETRYISYCNVENEIVTQKNNQIVKFNDQFHKSKLLCFHIGKNPLIMERTKSDEFIYDKKIQKQNIRIINKP